MKIEHFAINVKDPVAVADWYVENFNMSIARKMDEAPFTHFLKDSVGDVMVEIYNNPKNEVPDYASMNPLLLHLAFVSVNPEADRERLEAAEATFAEEVKLPDGSHLIMMRDPWGFSVQLCKRGEPML
ncbi:VOC family protein [Pelagicoccus albus]|uniref:VOC family protein n=1 Tax=Pelagicoccus albus TaxID=415222 RepID=A0A7X1B847_9BACT|nr:VOC family protein [Pelagicoccus albus]MBC2606135.1 VOC family protein [Pelagicoccus albus]